MHVCDISPGQTDEERFFQMVDIWVAHHHLTSMVFRSGSVAGSERRPRRATQEIDLDSVPTLADLLCGRTQGRTDDAQITYFGGRTVGAGSEDSFGSSGTGVQFSALGYDVYQRAKAAGIGQEIPTDWFFETLHP